MPTTWVVWQMSMRSIGAPAAFRAWRSCVSSPVIIRRTSGCAWRNAVAPGTVTASPWSPPMASTTNVIIGVSPVDFRSAAGVVRASDGIGSENMPSERVSLTYFGKAVVFVDVECVPRIVDPPVFYGNAAEIGNAFGDFACFGFDFSCRTATPTVSKSSLSSSFRQNSMVTRLSSTSSTTSTFLPRRTSGTGSSHWTF